MSVRLRHTPQHELRIVLYELELSSLNAFISFSTKCGAMWRILVALGILVHFESSAITAEEQVPRLAEYIIEE